MGWDSIQVVAMPVDCSESIPELLVEWGVICCRFISFCRVGTGLSDEELDAVVTKLKPFFRKNEYPKKAPPSFYEVTNNSKERPDVWIESPEKSIVLSITSDIRTIRSEVFAAPYSLRFPRIDSVRYDKSWHDCLDVQSFVELVHSSNGTTQRAADNGVVQDNKSKCLKSSRKGEKKSVSTVPPHFLQTDISHIKGETLLFSNMMFYFVNVPPTHSLDGLHKMVVENGGTFSMNLNNSVTHCIAVETKGIKFQAAKLRGDIIHYSWFLDCCLQKKLLPLQPKYFLFLSESSRKKLEEEIDEFSDPYYWDLDIEDIKQVLSNINRSEDPKTIDYYKGKFCPKDKWSRFHGCCIYFHPSTQALNSDSKVLIEIALRRMKLEISMGGGKVSNSLSQATHLVVITPLGLDVDFNAILKNFASAEVHLLRKKSLHVVGSQWLEDCFAKEQKLQEETYSLKPPGLEESNSGEWKHDSNLDVLSGMDIIEQPNMSSSQAKDGKQRKCKAALDDPRFLTSANKDGKRKRRIPTSMGLNKGKFGVILPRRTRARLGNKTAKISENQAEENENSVNKESEMEIENNEIDGKETVEDSDSSQGRAVKPQETGENSIRGEWFEKVHGIESGWGNNACNDEKLEVMVDPVHSMLLDMIPSLGTKKVDNADPVVEVGMPSEDITTEPAKKKRVSYKDVAGELLRDW
ncbi:DNA ligase (ATP) [Sarracenia purpurea var. burkii]